MAISRNPNTPRRRRYAGDRSDTEAATPPGPDPTPDNTTEHSLGHPNARGTLPMACHPRTPTKRAAAHVEPRPTRHTPATDPAPAGVSAAERALMRARLAAMATPRDDDSPRVAALRAILRDEALMAHVIANVEQWPPLTDEQRETLGALLHRSLKRPARRPGQRAA